MTRVPNAVSVDQSVIDACERMHALGVHHLPVMHEGQLVGVVTEHELRAIVDHGQADPAALAVGEVVSCRSCMKVEADTPLVDVVQDMAERGVDCCAVMREGQLAGILTTHDTPRLLAAALLESGPRRESGLGPSDVRTRILSEHQVLRSIYENAILAPALHDADAFGSVRAEELLREHRRQHDLLLEALDSVDTNATHELARA